MEDNKVLGMVADFQKAFDTPMTTEFWSGLIKEEHDELIDACQHVLKEYADFTYVIAGYVNAAQRTGMSDKDIEVALNDVAKTMNFSDVIDDMTDAFSAEVMGTAFGRVHKSNMSKLQPDGTVKRREDGKILKPDTYVAPDLTDLVS
nr:hypothetical protein [uncultured Cohaesibacter sp.]